MEITVHKADLSGVDSGGGYREVKAEITIDSSMPYRQQRRALIYETLASMLGDVIEHNNLLDIANTLDGALDQLGEE